MAPSPEMASKSWFCLCCIIVWTTLRLCWCAWLCLSQTAGWKPEVRAVIVIIYSRVPYSSLLEFSYFGRSWQSRIEQSFLGGAFHFQFFQGIFGGVSCNQSWQVPHCCANLSCGICFEGAANSPTAIQTFLQISQFLQGVELSLPDERGLCLYGLI